MKITSQQYAQSLYELTKDKSQKDIDVVVANFVEVITKNNQMKMADGIVKKFQEIHNAENGIVEAEVVSREKLDSKIKKLILFYLYK